MADKPLPKTRDQRFRVLSSTWDSNGSFQVQVLDTNVDLPATPEHTTAQDRRVVRDLARRVDSMQKIQWTRINSITTLDTEDGPRTLFHVTASRLDPAHR